MTIVPNRYSRRGLLASLTLSFSASVGLATGVRSAPPTAIVAGTNALGLRECTTAQCRLSKRASLGSSSVMLEGPSASMAKVADRGVTGFNDNLFQETDPAHPPYLIAGEPGCQRVALIFNVGVGNEPATGIMDTLAAEQGPATMFVMGWWAAEHPAILERMAAEGYIIGSHGDQANELTGLADDAIATDVLDAAAAIEHAIGIQPAPYFTPYAAATDERVRAVVAAMGYLNVGWEVTAADYGADATADGVYARVIDNMYDGAIVELHLDGPASAESTGTALPWMIRDLRAQGYQFVTIPEMAGPCP